MSHLFHDALITLYRGLTCDLRSRLVTLGTVHVADSQNVENNGRRMP